MWSHHLLVALRALRRDAGYSLLNGIGLAVALTCCVLIGLYARAELTYDRFHKDADRAVVMGIEHQFGQEMSSSTSTPYPLHLAVRTDAPAADASAMLSRGGDAPVLRPGQPAAEARVLYATPSLFDILTFPASAGDPVRALEQPEGAVVTAGAARRLFGDADPVGQRVSVETRGDTLSVVVHAVVTDPPRTSSIDFEIVLSALALPEDEQDPDGWGRWMWMTIGRLAPGATVADLDRQLAEIAEVHHGAEEVGIDIPRYFATALPDYHLSDLSGGGGFVGDARYLALFSAAALLVLLLGFINYVNLATARAARRAREIGVRKALGAGRGAVAAQFLVESVTVTVLSALVALALAALLLPAFNAGFETDLALADLDPAFLAAGFGFAVLVGLAAGAYPAAVLSRFDPAVVLRGGSSRSGRPSKNVLRRALVAVQFAVAIGLVAGTSVVLSQIAYTSASDLGVEPEGVVTIPLTKGRGADVPWQAALDAVRQSPHVVSATAATGIPGEMWSRYTSPLPSADGGGMQPMDRFISVAPAFAEPGYLDVLGIDLVAGREPRQPDEVTVNQAFVQAMGWESAADAIGETARVHTEQRIVGVMGDYHFGSMRDEIEPAVLSEVIPHSFGEGDAPGPKEYDYVIARIEAGQVAAAMDGLRRAWDGLGTGRPFEPEFLDDSLAEMYDADRRLAGVLGAFALVALVVACLGLVGLAAYTAQRRTREIGVRRALGATVGQIVTLLSREYAVLVAVGAVVAVPASVILLGRWLDGFAYRIALGPGLFAAAIALTLVVALAVVGIQAARAARVPPTRALRTD